MIRYPYRCIGTRERSERDLAATDESVDRKHERGRSRSGADGSRRSKRLRYVVAALVIDYAVVPGHCGEPSSQGRVPAQSVAKTLQPFELVRSLESLQDQIVLGKADAQAKLPKLLAQTAAMIAAEQKAWEDPRNLRAVITYAASGGQARVVRVVSGLGVARGDMKSLLDGVLAYVEGADDKAKEILLPIEAKTLPAPLAGHLALIQSNLVAVENPSKARNLLSLARVLAPGTLVEEAALRKEIFLADQSDDLDSFTNLSGQYIRRFDKSAYAENFRQRFRAAIMHFALTSDRARFSKLETVLALLEPEEAVRLLLATARSGLLTGKVEQARYAVEKAMASAQKESAEASRATLYATAIHVLAGDIDTGLAHLRSLEVGKLEKADVDLAHAVQNIAANIRALPAHEGPIGAEPRPSEAGPADSRENRASAAAAEVIRRAEAQLNDVGALLGRRGF
jgi:chemotaxis protein MotC